MLKEFMTPKQWFLSFLLGVGLVFFTFVIVYFQSSITVTCPDNTKEKYLKTELQDVEKICGGVNIYKFNDNTGLGAYFVSEENYKKAVEYYDENMVVFR